MKTQLLCTFTTTSGLDETIKFVKKSYKISANAIYVLENRDIPDALFCTYNVELTADPIIIPASTVGVHRKKQTNTLYTINALNQLIRELNGGVLDKKYPIQWDNCRDTLLVTAYGKIKIIHTQLKQTITVENNV